MSEFYQGNSFIQQPQQQQPTQTQPISRLANPTTYHLLRKSQKQNSSDGALHTPNNSFQNAPSNTFPGNTIDPQILLNRQLQQQQQFNMSHIKQEDAELINELDALSPQTNSSSNSSPPQLNRNYEEEFGRSFKPASHLDSFSFGGSPGNASSLYSPAIDSVEYQPYDEIAMSAPNTSIMNSIDVKSNINNPKINFRHPHNNLGGQITMAQSLPVLPTTGDSWFGTSLDDGTYQTNTHSGSLQYTPEIMYEEGGGDNQKQALLFEKRRRRRESHNAVERRRRDNINEKIQELSTLLPDLYVDSANKPNKGVILRKSVDYIRQLKSMVEQERNRNTKLESQVRELSGVPIDNNPDQMNNM